MQNNILCQMVFGSKLYGTDTPESDLDEKGIYLPELEEVILKKDQSSINNMTKQGTGKNSKDDVDSELYSMYYFLQLALRGETVALDMLHAPDGWEKITSPEWEFLKQNRSKFYTKNLKSYLSYLLHQVSKYGLRGSRLGAVKQFMEWIDEKAKLSPNAKLSEVWEEIKESEHCKKVIIEEYKFGDNRAINLIGRKLMALAPLWNVQKTVHLIYDKYGERAKKAERNFGVDHKAVSHAFRAAYQLKEIYTTGTLIYPLQEREYIKKIKTGKYHFKNDGIGEKLNDLTEEIKVLAEKSQFPEKPDVKFFEGFLLDLYSKTSFQFRFRRG